MTVAAASAAYVTARAAYERAAEDLRAALEADILTSLHDTVPDATARRVIEAVSAETAVPIDLIIGQDRHAHVCEARWLAMHLTRQITGHSLKSTGRIFRRTHGDVVHAERSVTRLADVDPTFAARLARLRAALGLPATT